MNTLEHDIARNYEYLPAEPLPKLLCKRSWRFLFISLIISFVLIFFGAQFGRQWFDSQVKVKPTVTLVVHNQQGQRIKVLADDEKYSAFVRTHITNLEKAKISTQQSTGEYLNTALKPVFAIPHEQVEKYADWYFSYDTTYKILFEALTSVKNHIFSTETQDLKDVMASDVEKYLRKYYQELKDVVASDVENYLNKYYEEIVLQPELTDPKLQKIYREALKQAHSRYVETLSVMQAEFQVFVAQHTTHLDDTVGESSKLEIDWDNQFNKIDVEQSKKDSSKTVSLSTDTTPLIILSGTNALSTKTKIIKEDINLIKKGIEKIKTRVASRAIASATRKGIFAKMTSPFVSKAAMAGSGGVMGTAGGGIIGTAIGVGAGLGIDYIINKGLDLMERDQFVADMRETIGVIEQEWRNEMRISLDQAIAVWFEDTIQLLQRFEQ